MSNGMSDALAGALLGIGLGEVLPARPNRHGAAKAPAGGYDQNPMGSSDTTDALDQVYQGGQTDVEKNARRLPPVDSTGASLDSHPIVENRGDATYQGLVGGATEAGQNTPDPNAVHPDKYDTALGDELYAARKARTAKAAMEAAHIGVWLNQTSTDNQNKASVIQQFHQKYPDVNITAQPYTTQQAKEISDHVKLLQANDQAQQHGLGPGFYNAIAPDGRPLVNQELYAKRAQDKMDAQAARETQRQTNYDDRVQAAKEKNDAVNQKIAIQKAAHETYVQANHNLDKLAPKPPVLTNIPNRDAAAKITYQRELNSIADQRKALQTNYYKQMGIPMPEDASGQAAPPASPVGAMLTPNNISPVPAAPNPQQQKLPVLHIGTPEQRAQQRATFPPNTMYFDEKTGQTVAAGAATSTSMLDDMVNMRR